MCYYQVYISPINSYYHTIKLYYILQGGETPLHKASKYGHLDVALLLLNKGADLNAKDGNGETPGQVAGTGFNIDEASKDRAEAIRIFIKRWPVLMTVLMLRELIVFHLGNIDLAMMDLFESIGDEEDFV